jgi:hypothetical protein
MQTMTVSQKLNIGGDLSEHTAAECKNKHFYENSSL